MNAIAQYRFGRILGLAAAVIAGLLSLGLAAPAFAMTVPHVGEGTPGPAIPVAPPTIKVISTGLASWQVALIAAGAALLGAAIVLLGTRWQQARRQQARPMAPSSVA
jgi:hypothetical protein